MQGTWLDFTYAIGLGQVLAGVQPLMVMQIMLPD